MMLNNREWATLFWIAVVLLVLLLRSGGRTALGQLANAFFVRPLLLITGLFIAWIALVVALGRAAGVWDLDLTKDTVIWAFTVGLPLLFKSAEDATTAGYYRRQVKQTVELSAFVAFYLNLVSAPLLAEIVLQPILAFVALAPTLTRTNGALARYQRFYDRLAAIVGLISFVVAAVWLIGNIHTIDPRELGLSVLLPIWLTVGVLPIIYVFSILFSYQSALLRLRWHSEDRRSTWKARLALALGFRLALRDLGAPGQGYQWGLAHSEALRDGLRVIHEFRRSLREQEATERRRVARLREFASVEGTLEEGRQLDRREFVVDDGEPSNTLRCEAGGRRNGR
ncbi:MAG: hypothetical protein ABSB34_12280 [Candidatus Limnocylindrales bacterium]